MYKEVSHLQISIQKTSSVLAAVPPPSRKMGRNSLMHIPRQKLMNTTRYIQILHPKPLILLMLIHTDPPIVLILLIDRPRCNSRLDVAGLIGIAIAESRQAVGVLRVRDAVARGVVPDGCEEGVCVVIDDFVAVGHAREGGFDGVVGGGDEVSEGILIGLRFQSVVFGYHWCELFRVDVGNEDVRGAGIEELSHYFCHSGG